MPCPNCNLAEYTPPGRCPQCQWEPSPEGTVEVDELINTERKSGDDHMNLIGSLLAGLFFFIAFWVVPSKRQNDWFHFQVSDIVAAAIISVIGYLGVSKMKD